jgi:hypothetical protein
MRSLNPKVVGGPVAKATSVLASGAPDGWAPSTFYKGEVLNGGFTRLVVSVPPDRLAEVHQALAGALEAPLKLLYQRLIDRPRDLQLPKPESHVAVELSRDRVLEVLRRLAPLIYQDGRHQLWLRGGMDEQLVLDDLGMIYVYPDDLAFRDLLDSLGLTEGSGPTMAERDYVRVNLMASCDQQEDQLFHDLHLTPWAG